MQVGDVVETPGGEFATVIDTSGIKILVEYDDGGFDFYWDDELTLVDNEEVFPL